MGLFSFLHKNKQDAAPGKSDYRSQSDEPFTNARTRTTRAARPNRSGKDAEPDPILPEKKRARRRLIGAVVLVLAVVIVLPMILDPEPKPLTDDIAIQIPSRDSKAAPAAPAAAVKPPDTTPLDAKQAPVETKPVETKSVEIPAEKPLAKTVEKPLEKVAEKPVEKLVEKPVEKPAAAPAKAEKAEKAVAAAESKHTAPAAAKVTDEQRALAILQGKTLPSDKVVAAKAAGKFVIQVAALATQEKIDELRNKLASAGISSYMQKVATRAGDRTRIRVGPFATHDEAEKARAKIVKLGLNATLIPT
ncbi:MAG TPA: SPOR domain-containing protein [Herbaspirillum sp.]|jgi:DedD protein|nr:SPOR domain-containing protein [Herbaspirillum sp.]